MTDVRVPRVILHRRCQHSAVAIRTVPDVRDSPRDAPPLRHRLHIRLLGAFELTEDGTPITTINTPRLQSLLAYLVLHRGVPQSRQQLAFHFWPDLAEPAAHTNLRSLVHQVRHALPDVERFLQVDRATLLWRAEAPVRRDVAAFETALRHAELASAAGDAARERAALEHAVALYQGDLLPGCYEEWVVPERERLQQALLAGLARLITLTEQAQDVPAAITYTQQVLNHNPLHEATYRQLMRLHTVRGDRTAALRTYHTCVTLLERELGVAPSSATQDAYALLLQPDRHSPVLSAPITAARPPLVGREHAWSRLREAWRIASTGRPQLVLITGEAGVGKTRLAEELLVWAGRQGVTLASARCYAAEGAIAYAPVATWLRGRPLPLLDPLWLTEVGRLVPDLLVERPDVPRPGPMTEEWQRQRLFEALARALLGAGQPLLLLLDDLQWCDQETLNWLHFLLRFNAQARLLVVGTLRPGRGRRRPADHQAAACAPPGRSARRAGARAARRSSDGTVSRARGRSTAWTRALWRTCIGKPRAIPCSWWKRCAPAWQRDRGRHLISARCLTCDPRLVSRARSRR